MLEKTLDEFKDFEKAHDHHASHPFETDKLKNIFLKRFLLSISGSAAASLSQKDLQLIASEASLSPDDLESIANFFDTKVAQYLMLFSSLRHDQEHTIVMFDDTPASHHHLLKAFEIILNLNPDFRQKVTIYSVFCEDMGRRNLFSCVQYSAENRSLDQQGQRIKSECVEYQGQGDIGTIFEGQSEVPLPKMLAGINKASPVQVWFDVDGTLTNEPAKTNQYLEEGTDNTVLSDLGFCDVIPEAVKALNHIDRVCLVTHRRYNTLSEKVSYIGESNIPYLMRLKVHNIAHQVHAILSENKVIVSTVYDFLGQELVLGKAQQCDDFRQVGLGLVPIDASENFTSSMESSEETILGNVGLGHAPTNVSRNFTSPKKGTPDDELCFVGTNNGVTASSNNPVSDTSQGGLLVDPNILTQYDSKKWWGQFGPKVSIFLKWVMAGCASSLLGLSAMITATLHHSLTWQGGAIFLSNLGVASLNVGILCLNKLGLHWSSLVSFHVVNPVYPFLVTGVMLTLIIPMMLTGLCIAYQLSFKGGYSVREGQAPVSIGFITYPATPPQSSVKPREPNNQKKPNLPPTSRP